MVSVRMARILKNDLHRAFTGKGFFLTIIILFAMQIIGQKENIAWGRMGSLVSHVPTHLGSSPMSWAFPGIGALCFADACLKDIQSKSYRYQLARMPLSGYVASKVAACFLSACVATMLGILMYILFIWRFLTGVAQPEEIAVYENSRNCFDILVVRGQYVLYTALHILCEGLAAGMWATLGMLLSTIWNNVYMALAAPTVLIYARDYVVLWLRLRSNDLLRAFQLGYIAGFPGVALPTAITIAAFAGISCLMGAAMYIILRRGCYA